MSLYPIIRDTKRKLYCGPTAICAVTGLAASTVIAEFDNYRGAYGFKSDGVRKGVRGVSNGELVAVLNRLGYKVVQRDVVGKPTVAQYIEGLIEQSWMRRIVNVRGHYIAIGGMGVEVCDTYSKQPVHQSTSYRGKRSRVIREFLIYEAAL